MTNELLNHLTMNKNLPFPDIFNNWNLGEVVPKNVSKQMPFFIDNEYVFNYEAYQL